jgi:isopenicillin N synthase-like dioxygenase
MKSSKQTRIPCVLVRTLIMVSPLAPNQPHQCVSQQLTTNAGSITLLFQDMAGGLQVLSPNGNFVDATPIEDTIVVNAADLLARWSNDTIKSTKHRVVEPPTKAEVHPARYSIAYFCNP